MGGTRSELAKRAIVLGGTKDKAFAIGTFLISFIRHHSMEDTDVVVFHDGMDRESMAAISRIHAVHFVEYEPPRTNDWHPNFEHFTPMVLSKFECLRLLNIYDSVTWFDYDMLVAKPLGEFFSPDGEGMKAILGQTVSQYLGIETDDALITRYADARGIHASAMLFNRSIGNYTEMYEWCLAQTARLGSILALPDQIILSLMVNNFDVSLYPISFEIYSSHPRDRDSLLHRRHVKIWHSFLKDKYWDGSFYDEDWAACFTLYLQAYAECAFNGKSDADTRNDDTFRIHGCSFHADATVLTFLEQAYTRAHLNHELDSVNDYRQQWLDCLSDQE